MNRIHSIVLTIIILFLVTVLNFAAVTPAFAQEPTPAGPNEQGIGCGGGLGPIGNIMCSLTSPSTNTSNQNAQVANSLNTLISGIVAFITIIAGIWFFIQFIIGGFQWISAGADKGLLEVARLRMLHAVIGLVIVVASYIIVGFIGTLLGLDIFNPGKGLLRLIIG